MPGSVVIGDALTATVIKSSSDNNSAGTFEIRFKNPYGRQVGSYNINDEIKIYVDTSADPSTLIMDGIIEDIIYDGVELDENLTIRGKDYSARLQDRTIEPEVYNNLPAGSIVKDIINKYTNNITTNNVESGNQTIDRIVFNQIPVFDGIKQLADLAGYIFYVDTSKDLHFSPKAGSSTGIVLDSGNVLQASFEERRDRIFNEIWVYGDRYLSNFREIFPVAALTDGSVATLLYQPHNTKVTTSTFPGSPLIGGIFNMGITSGVGGIEYLVSYDDSKIYFVSGTDIGISRAPLANGSAIIDYDRALPVVEVIKDNVSIANYGKRVMTIQDKNIKDPEIALNLAFAKIEEFSQSETEGNILIKGLANFEPNQVINVNLPFQNVNSQNYNIIEVRYDLTPEKLYSQEVITLRLNKKLPEASDFIKNLDLRIRKLESQDITNRDIITRTEFSTGSMGLRASGIFVESNTLGSSFILGKGYHGVSGPTFGGILGSIIGSGINFLGDSRSSFTINWSGGFF